MTFIDQRNQNIVRIVSQKAFINGAVVMQDQGSVYEDSKAVNSDLSEDDPEEN